MCTLFEDEEATPAVLTFRWETKAGEMVSLAALPVGGGEGGGGEDPVGADGAGPLVRMRSFLCLFLGAPFPPTIFFLSSSRGARGAGEPGSPLHRIALWEVSG